jgi:hypothetical protein
MYSYPDCCGQATAAITHTQPSGGFDEIISKANQPTPIEVTYGPGHAVSYRGPATIAEAFVVGLVVGIVVVVGIVLNVK